MSGHTPGPWYVVDEGNGQRYGEYDVRAENEIGDYFVASTYPGLSGAAADARLIAAAPDLLAAAKEMVRCYETPGIHESCWAQLEAAIAKAEGREP